MDEKAKKEIEQIIGRIECPKDFSCVKDRGADLCKAKDVGLEEYLHCLEKDPVDCVFALAFGDRYLCQCPVRVYLSTRLKK